MTDLCLESGGGATWAFGAGVPMGSGQRSGSGALSSFAQTIGGAQATTQLDMSYVKAFF